MLFFLFFFGFPDFSSVQCENEMKFSFFKIIIFTFESMPIPDLSTLNGKITFLYDYRDVSFQTLV